jgi:hypothetical protein
MTTKYLGSDLQLPAGAALNSYLVSDASGNMSWRALSTASPLADGTSAAAGSVGTASDAGHVHPLPGLSGTISNATIASSTTNTMMGYFTIPANQAAAGSTFNFRVTGVSVENDSGPSTIQVSCYNGTTTGSTLIAASNNSQPTTAFGTAHPWVIEGYIRFTSASACNLMYWSELGFGGGTSSNWITGGATAFSMTAANSNSIGFSWKWGSSFPTDTVTVTDIYAYQVS